MTKCKNCLCDCHCNVSEHSDANGVCACEKCNCNPQGATVNNDECLSCQQTKNKLAICIPKKKKNQVHVVKKKNDQENAEALTYEQSFMVRTSSVKELVKQENECYPGQPDET